MLRAEAKVALIDQITKDLFFTENRQNVQIPSFLPHGGAIVSGYGYSVISQKSCDNIFIVYPLWRLGCKLFYYSRLKPIKYVLTHGSWFELA